MSTSEKQNTETNRLYQSLEPQELETLIARAQHVSFSAGTTIIPQGTKSAGIYVILEGSVIIAGQIVGEGRVNLTSLKQGNIFGGSSVIIRGPNATSVVAETDTRCLLITEKLFEMLSTFHPSMKYKIMKEIAENSCHRLTSVAHKIMDMMSNSDMLTRSLFGEVFKSLTKYSIISLEEAALNSELLLNTYPISLFNYEGNTLLEKTTVIKAPDQCTLIEEGSKDQACYLVLKGAVQSSIISKNRVAKISILGPRSLFCSLSLISDDCSPIINYTTCERAILLKIEKSKLDELKSKEIKLWYQLFDLICESIILLSRFTEKLDIRINSEIYNR